MQLIDFLIKVFHDFDVIIKIVLVGNFFPNCTVTGLSRLFLIFSRAHVCLAISKGVETGY